MYAFAFGFRARGWRGDTRGGVTRMAVSAVRARCGQKKSQARAFCPIRKFYCPRSETLLSSESCSCSMEEPR